MQLAAELFGSRGSCFVDNDKYATHPKPNTPDDIIIVTEGILSKASKIRPLPEGGGWFETVWNEYNLRTRKQ